MLSNAITPAEFWERFSRFMEGIPPAVATAFRRNGGYPRLPDHLKKEALDLMGISQVNDPNSDMVYYVDLPAAPPGESR